MDNAPVFRWVLLCLLWASAVQAACIDADVEKLYTQENVALLDRQVASLVAKTNRSRNDVLLLGLAAYRDADLKLLKNDKDGASNALSSAADVLKERLEKGADAELETLLGLIYGMQIRMSPWRGIWLGSAADKALEHALTADPNNPRPHLAAGINLLYKPSGVGGGADKAVSQLQKAVDLYPAAIAKSSAADTACWGTDDATLALARARMKNGDRVAAISLVEGVLARSPENRNARRLMDAIRRSAEKAGGTK